MSKMKTALLILLASLALFNVEGIHLKIGQFTGDLAHSEQIQYNAFPLIKRVKFVFYNQPDNRIIQGIQALDNLHSKATINVTAGGVGHSYVNLRLKSERGVGLDYSLGIYVAPYHYVQ